MPGPPMPPKAGCWDDDDMSRASVAQQTRFRSEDERTATWEGLTRERTRVSDQLSSDW